MHFPIRVTAIYRAKRGDRKLHENSMTTTGEPVAVIQCGTSSNYPRARPPAERAGSENSGWPSPGPLPAPGPGRLQGAVGAHDRRKGSGSPPAGSLSFTLSPTTAARGRGERTRPLAMDRASPAPISPRASGSHRARSASQEPVT